MKLDLELKKQVKEILSVIQKIAPGKSVELRIPPYAAIQCVTGVAHRRGTPPNVVEMNAETLKQLVKKPSLWTDLCKQGLISAPAPIFIVTPRFVEMLFNPTAL